MKLNNKYILTALFSTITLGAMSLNTDLNSETVRDGIFNVKEAEAIASTPEYMAGGIITDNIFKVDIPAGSVPAELGWGIAGETEVKIINGKINGTRNGELEWWNQYGGTVYENKKGSKYRLTNVGLTSDGQALDIIMEVTGDTGLSTIPKGTTNGFNFFKSGGNYSVISIESVGIKHLKTRIDYVKSGTDTPVNIITGTYWADIDYKQGLNETQSNKQTIFGPKSTSMYWMDIHNNTVYARRHELFSGMNDPNESAYIGIGYGTGFNLDFYHEYEGPNTVGPMRDETWNRDHSKYNFRYEMFGRFNNIAFPPTVNDPVKTVSDVDEEKVTSSSTGLTVREQEYDMSIKVSGGTYLEDLTLMDTFPQEFKTDKSRVKITGLNGQDITNLFDINVSGQNLTVKLKENQRQNKALFSTRINVNVRGSLPEWAGTKFDNKANWNYNNKNMPTNNVSTVTPSKPTSSKRVSVSNGAEWEKADTLQTAAKADKVLDPYRWQMDFELSNYTNYTGIQLVDHLENIQDVDLNQVKVYDTSTGTPRAVTNRGKLSTKPNGTKNDVIWTANSDYVSEINTAYGLNRATKPKFMMDITTDISKATREQKDAYKNNELGYIIVPNTASLIETDHTGSVTSKTNPSHVTFPNEIEEPKKKVTDNGGENKVDKNHPGLKARNQEYDISIKTSHGYGFNRLELTDTFPKEFKTDTSKVVITNSSGTDLTHMFNITLQGQNFKAELKSEFKNNTALKGTVINAKIKGTIPEWLGESFPNQANWTADVNKPTNKVETFLPSKPEVKKSVSVDNGSFIPAATPKEAAKITRNKDSYTWKLDYTLSNFTKFSGIEFVDEFENLQTFNKSDFKVFDDQGRDVTNQGTLTETPNGDKTKLSWKASAGYLNTVNSTYGQENKTAPKFTVTLKTDLSKATRAQKAKYVNSDTGYIVIPNVGSLIETDHTGSVTEASNKSHITPPNELFEPKKKVSDDDEKKVDANWTELKVRHQEYDISVETDKGYGFNELELQDTFPKEFVSAIDQIQITNSSGKNLNDLFNISLQGQVFRATLKAEHFNNADLKGTTINANIKGNLPDWVGYEFQNEAKWVADYDKPTNKVSTFAPSKPEVIKEVSIDEGKTWTKSDKPETAAKIFKNKDPYQWKLSYTLPNYTKYTGITLSDSFENLQTYNKDNIKVYDEKGVDVTNKGSISIKDSSDQKYISWQASSDYVSEVNGKFGIKSKETPKFTMINKTDMKSATRAQKDKYVNAKTGYIVIPNIGDMKITDRTGSVVEKSNTSHITVTKILRNIHILVF